MSYYLGAFTLVNLAVTLCAVIGMICNFKPPNTKVIVGMWAASYLVAAVIVRLAV